MNKELKAAIKLIEESGGIVMFHDPDEDFSVYDHEEIIAIEAEEKQRLQQWQKEREERLEELAKDFDKMLGSRNFSFTGVEDLCAYHGCDLDDIEDIIHGYY